MATFFLSDDDDDEDDADDERDDDTKDCNEDNQGKGEYDKDVPEKVKHSYFYHNVKRVPITFDY